MKKILLMCLLLLGNMGMAGIGITDETPAMEIFFIANRNALELAKEICLEEKAYLTENFAYSCGLVGKLLYEHGGSDKEREVGYKLLMKACDNDAGAFFGEACYLAAKANDSNEFKQPALAKKYVKRTMEYLSGNCDWEYKRFKEEGGDFYKSVYFATNISRDNGWLNNYRHLIGANQLFFSSGYHYGETCSLLGKIYGYGQIGVKRDREKALMYFKRVCEMEEGCEYYDGWKSLVKGEQK